MALKFKNRHFRLFVRKSLTMPKICVTKKFLVLVVLVSTNVLAMGYFILVSKGIFPRLEVSRGLTVPKESPSKHIFDRLQEIRTMNSKEPTHFVMDEFQNKSNEKIPRIKDIVQRPLKDPVQRPLKEAVQSYRQSQERFNHHDEKEEVVNRKLITRNEDVINAQFTSSNSNLQILTKTLSFPPNDGRDQRGKLLLPNLRKLSYPSDITVTTNATKPVHLCIAMDAGLANRLYMYASSYSLAKDKGMTLVITAGMATLDATFHVIGTYKKDPNLCPKTKQILESACCKLAPNMLKLPNDKSVRIKGYLQSFRYFEKYHKELTKVLTFREVVLNEAKAKLHRLLSEKYVGETKNSLYNRTLVGIHIRRGDYNTKQSMAFGYRMAPKEYIFKAQDYMKRKFSNVTFVACSNDVVWTRKVFHQHNDVIVAPMGPASVDLALLALMNHTIITVGTYGFWAAWLNPQNGTVLYYKDFVGKGSLFARGFASPNTHTYYPYWIGL